MFGIGMSDRVAALRGRFELESPPGGGTTVVATLPIANRDQAIDPAP